MKRYLKWLKPSEVFNLMLSMTGLQQGPKPMTIGRSMKSVVGIALRKLLEVMLLVMYTSSIAATWIVVIPLYLSFLLASLVTLSLGMLLGVANQPISFLTDK